MKNICVVTGTRADYGLLYWPIKELQKLKDVQVNLVATGSHLSKKHGHTVDAIKADGFVIDAEIDIEIEGDRPGDILRVMGCALNKFSNYFEKKRPDLLLVLGDRYEIFSVVQAAMVHNIPIAHIHGGEVTEGAIDDSIRHAITKMSHFHFTSTEEYRKRVIQMGEDPSRVFCVGAPGLDNIKKLKLLSKNDLEISLGCTFNEKNVLVTFHPVSVSERQTIDETKNFFGALNNLPKNISFFVTMPNADTYSENILPVIEKFKKENPTRVYLFTSLGQLRYLSLMNQVDVVAGNSSSGIIEAPFMEKIVINVGDRQKGRLTAENIICVSGSKVDIEEAFAKALSAEFKNIYEKKSLLYGDGEASLNIASIINSIDSSEIKVQKRFIDLLDKNKQ